MNLSCGKCGVIRPFSGTPPTCDVCGWSISDRAKTPKTSTPRRSGEWVANLVGVAVVVGVILLVWAWWSPPSWYALRYGTDTAHVFVQPEPHDCDFLTAPLGIKRCRYEKAISTDTDPKTGAVIVYVNWNKIENN